MAVEGVILLHGLARRAASMKKLQKRLQLAGYFVANISYPSRKYPIEILAKKAIEAGLIRCQKAKVSRVHFVTHSLGGLLVRQYLANATIPNLGRVVMLAPPNKGSEVVDKLRHLTLFRWLNGPIGQQLTSDEYGLANCLPEVDFEVAIIAGTKSVNPLLSRLINGTNDGTVSVTSTHLNNETDFLALPVSHPFIMRNNLVIENVLQFLHNGKFKH